MMTLSYKYYERLMQRKIVEGEKFTNVRGGWYSIVAVVDDDYALVKHGDKHGHVSLAKNKDIRLGSVKNPYHPKIFGVGYMGVNKEDPFAKDSKTREYSIWYSMLARCYNRELQIKTPSYIGCTVADEWHDLQKFSQWYKSQEFNDCGYDMDKDLLSKERKVYSPDTCCLIPKDLNTSLVGITENTDDAIFVLKNVHRYQKVAELTERYRGLVSDTTSKALDSFLADVKNTLNAQTIGDKK